ncbi:MAG: hypothetical protein JNL08_20965 [Planctomycetes bacterium]|nr:hypothetical protein [Planctomycetota bacterium]
MGTPHIEVVAVPAAVVRLRPVRRFARWALLVGWLVGSATWSLAYADDTVQMGVALLGVLGWWALGFVGIGVTLVEWSTLVRSRRAWRHVRPGWGTLLWVAIPFVHLAAMQHAFDARVWWWLHQRELAAVLAAGAPAAGRPAPVAGATFTVEVQAPALLVVRVGRGWEERGVAFDPEQQLAAGSGGPAGSLWRVHDLGGGWRAWSRGD